MTQIIYGRHPVLAALRQSESPLEEIIVAQGAKGQWLYEVKVRECEFHLTDKKGNPVDESTEIAAGEIVNVYGKPFFDARMRQVKPGQVFGLKYVSDLEATVAGYNDTKEIKVFTPKGDDGEFEFDDEVLNQLNVDNFDKDE